MNYLTEKGIGIIINEFLPKNDFIYNKSVPGSKNTRLRPDYRSDSKMLIVEFDGYFHYSQSKVIKSDRKKDSEYTQMGYRVFRIPYFIQMTSDLFFNIFDVKIKYDQQYKHGFVSDKAMLPCDFCELGIKRFLRDLQVFTQYKEDIIGSLKIQLEGMGDSDLVIPPSLNYLIK